MYSVEVRNGLYDIKRGRIPADCSAHAFSHIHWLSACVPRCMLLLDKEASNRKQEIDYQHHTIP